VFNHWAETSRCLAALAAAPAFCTFEVIVVDDTSTDETQAEASRVPGLRYHRRTANGGFIASCTDGASLARGEFLVFLNNDTVPQPGWLDALVDTFANAPDVGLVGAELVYPDGRLQEAGGIVFSDASAANYGRLSSPDDPRFSFVRDVDYCSGAAIAVRGETFRLLGGFDDRYRPAYYEDTDLAFAVRAAGLRVVYQPAAKVVHLEGVSSGTDVRTGVKAYQVRNQSVFATKWADTLAYQPPPGVALDVAALDRGTQTVLVVDDGVPRPDHDSGSLRLVNLMRLLQEEGAHVVFRPFDNKYVEGATRALQRDGVETWHAPYGGDWQHWLREHGPRFSTVVVCRYHVGAALLPMLRRFAPQARVVFDTVDLHFLRERRQAEINGSRVGARTAERTEKHELRMVAEADRTLVVSPVEQQILRERVPDARVDLLPNLHKVSGPGLGFGDRHDLVFVGGFQHEPNVDAVLWFVNDVFPVVRRSLPHVRFHCVGPDAGPEIRALGSIPGVVVHGHVPDLTDLMDGVRLSVAPLRFGAGVKGKINMSMAHGQPVVATSLAVEGMHLTPEQDVLVGDTAEDLAAAIVRVYQDAGLWQRLADGGLRNVAQHFSIESGRAAVRGILLAGQPA
jgi:GT2 family glycosyltransferase/glycosyltransferase involved in cell wall biosynthesis